MFCGVYYRLINLLSLSFCYKLSVFGSILCPRSPRTWFPSPACNRLLTSTNPDSQR